MVRALQVFDVTTEPRCSRVSQLPLFAERQERVIASGRGTGLDRYRRVECGMS